MTNTCVTLLNPISENRTATLHRIAETATRLGVPALLCGAFARDLLFWHMHGIHTERETMDMDVSVQVDGWGSYNELRDALIDDGFTSPNTVHPEKLIHPQTSREVDLLPFGEIAKDGKTIIWPQDSSKWSVVGLDDALAHSLKLEVIHNDQTARLSFITAPALVMLKIVATHDRPEDRYKKDSTDIGFVIRNYRKVTGADPLQTPEGKEILDRTNSDLDLAVAVCLGRAIRSMASTAVIDYVADLIKTETSSQSRCYLARGLRENYCNGSFPRARQILQMMADGLTGTI